MEQRLWSSEANIWNLLKTRPFEECEKCQLKPKSVIFCESVINGDRSVIP